MTSWRDTILAAFVPQISRLTLVADPDAIFTDERLRLELLQRGFDLIEFSDPVEFRYAYESQYRSIWDRGDSTSLVVALRLPDSAIDALPYDLLRAGKRLSFNMGSLFPNFSYPVLQLLDSSVLDALFDAQTKDSHNRMGDNATKDFVLRHIFGIAAELITTDVELLRVLLRLHYRNTNLPPTLSTRLVQVIKVQAAFRDWPLETIVPDEAAFYAFLQERWATYLRNHDSSGFREDGTGYGLIYPGPAHLPFGHHDIRVYIDNLFVEGRLTPIHLPSSAPKPQDWMRGGIVTNTEDSNASRIARLFELVDAERPNESSRHTDWIAFAHKWAELSALVHTTERNLFRDRFREAFAAINDAFACWLDGHYASLINLPPSKPAMVHHVARLMARELEQSKNIRTALIVMDGLALDQWITVRHSLQKHDRTVLMRESAIFAWIPTLTSISRQAIFAGKPPFYFGSSLHSTHAEGNLWRKFWEDNGFTKAEIAYQKSLGDMPASGDIDETLDTVLTSPKHKIVGLVVDKVDKIMHGMQLGSAGMHNQIAQWCQGGFLAALIGRLLDRGYDVWLTADHGNIECSGNGRPSEGVMAEVRGERVRIYPTPELRDHTAAAVAFARAWNPVGLPPETFPLVAHGNDAFGTLGDMLVGHGGIAIEEVIVPLIKFERQDV
ncbi:BREX-3 system phosphatase PglZ [Agrobacterium rosae]|uniref:PglZ domain protein n=1 Tax=Agrobacterium rosae TaxID=1972867 RepID=A0A1R3U1R3_9HYPH|nr:BREX-3 system phosphatase PglZ [Agrobacterium rosae]SCX35210.1 PglZ domain protein [Agrobacterium rosae]